jgi:hypothetical protein
VVRQVGDDGPGAALPELTTLVDLSDWPRRHADHPVPRTPVPWSADPTALPGRPLAAAEAKTLRWALWHTPARPVRRARRRVVRILDTWSTGDEVLAAYRRTTLTT